MILSELQGRRAGELIHALKDVEALRIFEKLGNEHGAASSYHQLGMIAGRQGRFEEAGRWLLRCLQDFLRLKDLHNAKQAAVNFVDSSKQAPPPKQAKLRALWEEADPTCSVR